MIEDKLTKYPIIWMRWRYEKLPFYNFSVGVCGYSWMPAFIGTNDDIETAYEFSLHTSHRYCEKSKHCLSTTCKFSKTTSKNISMFKKVPVTKMREYLKYMWSQGYDDWGLIGFARECKKEYTKNPKATYIDIKGNENAHCY